jgi:hypothetical protein
LDSKKVVNVTREGYFSPMLEYVKEFREKLKKE